jgi:hypothetical protein
VRLRYAVLVFVAALCGYLLLHQDTMYSVDAHTLLMDARHGVPIHRNHFAYLPLLALCREVVSLWHGTIYQAGILLSAAGTALGVTFMHAANLRLGLPRSQAAIATALSATAPAIVFFATIVELHGEHLGLCGPAFLATAAFADRPVLRRGILLGLATGLGFAGHATGAVLPAIAIPCAFVLAWERPPRAALRAIAGGLGLAAVVHGMIVLLLPLLLRLLTGQGAGAAETAAWLAHPPTPAALAYVAWHDWLRPYCPLAPLCLLALFVRRSRLLATATLAAAACYVAITAMLLGEASERGAYLVPLAWPMGVVAVRALPPRWLVPLLLAGALLSLHDVKYHDTRPHRAFADGYHEAIGSRRAFVITGTYDEVASFLIYLPDSDWHLPLNELAMPPGQFAAGLAAYDLWLDEKTAAGTELWITAGGVETLRDPAWTLGRPAGPRLLEHLRERYRWEEHTAPGFTAWQLLRP